ncbi:MAG: DUF4286 family protein [Sphingobacteriales bacterium]|nr:MAG: DUF4286 family protein [Sphingobacteriales bacterium]
MFIYNVTSKVSWQIQEQWLNWMLTEHIVEILETGMFLKYQLVRLQDVEDLDGPTFAVQYYLDTRENYDRYVARFASGFSEKSIKLWGDQVISFRTLMEVIN